MSILMLENRHKEPLKTPSEGKPLGNTQFETRKIDTGKSLVNAVEISFICSFGLV